MTGMLAVLYSKSVVAPSVVVNAESERVVLLAYEHGVAGPGASC